MTAYAKSFAAAALVALLASAPASARPATGTGATQAPPVGGEAVPAPSPSATPVPSSKPVPYGVSTAPGPAITRLDCAASCAGAAVRPGSLLRVRGKAMQRGEEVVFLGAAGEGDDVAAATTVRRRTSVDVRVPLGAPAGPVAVVDRDRRTSAASVAPLTMATSQAITLAGAAPAVELAVRAPRAYYGAVQPAALTYVVHAPAPIDATVELTRVSDGVAIARWPAPQVAPDTPQTVTWDGTAGGAVQRDGEYAFRVSLAGVDGPPQPASFTFSRDRFPLLGPHVFGTGGAAFGGGRGHQGQDVFAACGTPLVAAHAGTVKYAGFQSRAGFYLVTDNDGATTDYSYMHLREEALVKAGDHVVTGQLIGYVGDTGDADGCHLHFEIWTAPGWYAGGQPIDPLPSLRAWDRRS